MNVRMLKTVLSDMPIPPILKALKGQEYHAKMNLYGAVSVWVPDHQAWLGVKPGEFQIIALTDDERRLLTREPPPLHVPPPKSIRKGG